MRRTSIFLVALPLLGACSAAQMTEGLRQFNEAAAANLVSGESVSESGVKTGGFRVGQLVTGSISSPSEIDEFKMEGTAGQELILYASAPKREGEEGWQHQIRLGVLNSEGGTVGGLLQIWKGLPLENQYSQSTIRLPATGTYTVRVVGATSDTRGPYRFIFREVNRAPETAAQRIAAGQMVSGEAIDSPGDIDEFKMEGTAGQELILYASAPKQEGDHGWYHDFKIDVVSPEGSSVRGMKVGKGVPLENQHSDVIRLPSTGTYTVRVVGAGNSARGPYRFVFRPRQ